MPVRKEAWKNPEIATEEELLEMVLEQRAWLKAAKKKAAKANIALAKFTESWHMASYWVNMALMRFHTNERIEGDRTRGMLALAKGAVVNAQGYLRKPYDE